MSVADWDRGYDKASHTVNEIQANVAERDSARRSGTAGSGAASLIKPALNNLDRLLNRLDRELRAFESATPPPVSSKDLARRREDLRRLQNEHTRLKGLDRAAASADRDTLMGGGSASSFRGGAAGAAAEGASTRDLSTQQLVERSEAEIKTQDEIIDKMSEGLTSLTSIGKAIGDETTLHLKLLDKFEDEVDRGNTNLERETDRAKTITKQAATCWLYIIICVLLLVLIVLIGVRYA